MTIAKSERKWDQSFDSSVYLLHLELGLKVLRAQGLVLLTDGKITYSNSWNIGNMVRFDLALYDDTEQERDHRYVYQ